MLLGDPVRRCRNCGREQTQVSHYEWMRLVSRRWHPPAGRCKPGVAVPQDEERLARRTGPLKDRQEMVPHLWSVHAALREGCRTLEEAALATGLAQDRLLPAWEFVVGRRS